MLRLIGTIGHLVNPITMTEEVKIVSVLTFYVPTKDNGLISCVNMLDKSFVKSISYSLQLPMLPAFNRFLLSPEEDAAVANREREEGGGGGAGGGANEQVGCV